MTYIPSKPKMWPNKNLKGNWLVTRKIDGVRMLRDLHGNPVSRKNKPLYNLNNVPKSIIDAEIFHKTLGQTISIVRSTKNDNPISLDDVYSLNPLDKRLIIQEVNNPSAKWINDMLNLRNELGDEGLVLYQNSLVYKVKSSDNYDVKVTGYLPGSGKYLGYVGSLITPMGNVSGFSDDLRKQFTKKLPDIIEVECMSLTSKGKFRHPRFIRERFDK